MVVHGLATRCGASLGLVPAAVWHRIATTAFASLAVLSAGLLVVAEWLPEPWPPSGAPTSTGLSFGPFVTLGVVVYPFPILAFTAAACGARSAARALLGLTCLAVCATVPAAAHSDAERPQMYLLVVLCLLAAMAAAGLPPTIRRRDLFAAAVVFGLFLAVATARSMAHFHQAYSGAPWNYWSYPLLAYRGPTGLLDTLEMTIPAAIVIGALAATMVSVRHPGWILTTSVVGGTWSLMPIANSVRYGRWAWEDNYAGSGFVLLFGLITIAATIDLFRAAGLRVVRTATAVTPEANPGEPADGCR
ncbi:hypothetical protein AB1484_14335 [Parafrankia sp. FMc6]|uniref:hypothetical protein n=1 Tax=Parafrankia soli TaxID=2599596 RepID=UPI0034D3A27F